MEEPSMLVQRPSSGHSQQTSHILVGTFRELYSQDSVNQDTVRNLTASKSGDHGYHDRYVERLQVIQNTWEKKVKNAQTLVNHLEEAQKRARHLEEQEYAKKAENFQSYSELGLPPVSSKLHVFMNKELLQSNNLIIPISYQNKDEKPSTIQTEGEHTPQYASSTFSSRLHFETVPSEDNYFPEPHPILPMLSNTIKPKPKIFQRKSKTNGTMQDKNIWRKCITPQQRETEKKDILNLQKKADFLKNPRFVDQPKAFLNKSTSNLKDESQTQYVEYFKPYPFPVIFQNYEADEVYEIKLELRNVTASSRQVRILQPKSPYFSVSHGEFPTESGLVAPGMCCQYTICFSPDSLADYDDIIEVKTQAQESLLIPVQARREPPALSLPSHMDCGFSLVGNTKCVKYMVHNNGGPGRFYFKPEESLVDDFFVNWDQVDFVGDNMITTNVFSLQPCRFVLKAGECIDVDVTFNPTAVKIYSTKLFLFCDNCVCKEYILEGTGEIAHVEMSFADGGVRVPFLGETYDESADHIIQFENQYPQVVCEKELHIKNVTSVPLQFEWKLFTPLMLPSESSYTCSESVFDIQPVHGYLEENNVTKFLVKFNPLEVGSFYDVASFILKNIPMEVSENYYTPEDQTTLKYSLKGYSQHYSVSVHPPVMILSGKSFIGKLYSRSVTLRNDSNAETTFKWKCLKSDGCAIEVLPSEGTIGANKEIGCVLHICGKTVGQIQCFLEYEVPYSSFIAGVHIEGIFNGPEVNFVEKVLDYGLIRYGTSENKVISLHNSSPTEAAWNLSVIPAKTEEVSPFTFHPSEGVLHANEIQSVAVHFKPAELGTLKCFTECLIDGGKSCYLPIRAEVQRPHVVLLESHVLIEEAFLNVPIVKHVSLVNTTLLPAQFSWNKVTDHSNQFSMSCEPQSGTIHPREQLKIEISLTFHALGCLDFFATCHVQEMLSPVIVAIKSVVKGLHVDFSLPNMQDLVNEEEVIRNNDILEFGSNVLIGTPACALLMIENRSAIKTTYTVHAKHFLPSRLPTPPLSNLINTRKLKSFGGRALLSKTANIADYNSTTDEQFKKDYTAKLLRDGRGMAFVCTPDTGILQPFEKKVISVTAHSDMWGEYSDVLVCKIGNLEEKLIPLHIDVIGSPLSFQMTKEQPPLVRFGAHVSGGHPVNRNLRINNSSNVGIRLDWTSYVIDVKDKQLVDLDVYIGDAFPLYNENGDEVLEMQEDDRLIRVVLNEHFGKRSDAPFKVDTPQVVIPARGKHNISVSFHPLSGVHSDINYLGYALGYMTLDKQDRGQAEIYSRLDGLDMLPFSLNMNGDVKPAKLYLEACDEEGFTFELSATEVLNEQNTMLDSLQCTRRFVLVNNSGTTVSFTCNVTTPFKLISIDEIRTTAINKSTVTLKSQKNVQIKLAFELNRELATSHHKKGDVNINEKMTIIFSNKTTQTYHLTGIVNYPSFTLSSDNFNFGSCFVSGMREMTLALTNPSNAALYWKIEKDQKSPNASKSVFTLSCTNGKLEAGTRSSECDNVCHIKIRFTPRHNVAYGCVLNIVSIAGERYLNEVPVRISLSGVGSYDEASREKMSV